jgi:ribosomal protein S18 acetylase RimI-like enzyme
MMISNQLPSVSLRLLPDRNDPGHVRRISTASGYFRPDEVDVAVELVEEALEKGDASGYHFIFAETDNLIAGYCCFGPIPCTIGSFDLYWIAVDNSVRRQGIGRTMLAQAEKLAASMGGRQMYIETSSLPMYHDTHAFYIRNGYEQVSELKNFYQDGDHKITYMKQLVNAV